MAEETKAPETATSAKKNPSYQNVDNIYTDEKFYKDVYLYGKNVVITSNYEYFFREASLLIDRYTCGNINSENVPQVVRMCCCELAENMFSENRSLTENSGIQSESVGGWSRNYTSKSEILTNFRSEQKCIIYKWLADTGLLYRGVE
ncbi:MAG: hypothetical protein K2H26_04245 [Ruminococcus sp.]|nr:hypothetical protein [Ruminococcus sp.]